MKELISSGKIKGEFYTLTSIPVRICDIGGWLDTWFAVNGDVLNFSVLSRYANTTAPFRGVDILVHKTAGDGILEIMAADPVFDVVVKITDLISKDFDKKNLLLATLSLLLLEEFSKSKIIIRIESPIPPGASMGTSAAISVGLLKALGQFLQAEFDMSQENIAKTAFRAETEVMGGQSGTQDQWSASFGSGAQMIKIDKYPNTAISAISISNKTKEKLEEGMITVFVGQHSSSQVHSTLIAALEQEGEHGQRLEGLRTLALGAKNALEDGDLISFGKVMTKNTESQRHLHSGLVGKYHDEVIALAKKSGALGYKVNGAGGEGGSVSVLFSNKKNKTAFYKKALSALSPEYKYFEHQIVG